MKKTLQKTLSLLLILALSLPALTVPGLASWALGEDLTKKDTLLNEGTALSTDVFWSSSYSDLRTENLITYTPSAAVTPIVTSGAALTSCNRVTTAAKQLESAGYRVVAGINGDFFNVNNGLPTGIVITEGQLRSSDGGYYAVGFRADGTAILGRPGVTLSADLGYQSADSTGYSAQRVRRIAGVNKARTNGGIYLYTYDFNARHTTGNTEPGVDVICSVTEGALTLGGTLKLRVEEIAEAASATAVGKDQVILSANANCDAYFLNALAEETVGNEITITVSAAEGWEQVQYALGSLYALVENGKIVSGLPTGAAPRTAVGQKADGTLVFYTIDGRKSGYSIGATLSQVAERLIELKCVTALCLDGGGSTALTVTQPDETASALVNIPSEGSERSVSNQIFLVASNQPSGVLHHLYVTVSPDYVLAGTKVTAEACGVDTGYLPMETDYTLSASAGTLDGAVLTTPAEGGTVTVTARSGSCSGTAAVTAIRTPDRITVKNGTTAVTSLTLAPGKTVQLSAEAFYNHLPLAADAELFRWTLEGEIGTLSSAGALTVTAPGSGTVTVQAGDKTVRIPVTVTSVPLRTVEDFESSGAFLSGSGNGMTLSAVTAADQVKLGRRSAVLSYTLDAENGNAAQWRCAAPLAALTVPYTQLNLWVCGDGSGNLLSLLYDGADGSELRKTLAALDFTGWKQLCVTLPEETVTIRGVEIAAGSAGTAHSGSIRMDQLVASYRDIVDTAVPEVTASLSGSTLSARITDAVDGIPAKSAVRVTLDGKNCAFTYDAGSGALTCTLPVTDGEGHRVTVTAKDASGNIGRASCDLPAAESGHKFTDTEGYWAADFVDYLYTSGITTGYSDGTFRPGQNITRQQFAVMLFRYLKLDEAEYESLPLPFADSASVGGYAVTAVKALYALGIIGGTERNGKLYFNPNGTLTRAQAAAMIGRTQEKGYAQSAAAFTDAAAIPAYAESYIRSMTAQGVLGGYEDGSFRPASPITRGQMAKILYNLL